MSTTRRQMLDDGGEEQEDRLVMVEILATLTTATMSIICAFCSLY
jgi:hypothetical protein